MAEKIGHAIAIITAILAVIIFFVALSAVDSERILLPIVAALASGGWLMFLCRDRYIG